MELQHASCKYSCTEYTSKGKTYDKTSTRTGIQTKTHKQNGAAYAGLMLDAVSRVCSDRGPVGREKTYGKGAEEREKKRATEKDKDP